MIRPIASVASTVLVLGGCGSAPPVDRETALAALREAAVAYQEAASAKDAPAVVAFYDDDAVMVPPGAARVQGIDAVRDYRFGFIETPGVELVFELARAEVADGGDMGWTLAIGDITIRSGDGAPTRDRVRDVHTWRRQTDGSWKIVLDVWNSEPPSP